MMADWNERYSRGEHIIKEPLPLLVHLAESRDISQEDLDEIARLLKERRSTQK